MLLFNWVGKRTTECRKMQLLFDKIQNTKVHNIIGGLMTLLPRPWHLMINLYKSHQPNLMLPSMYFSSVINQIVRTPKQILNCKEHKGQIGDSKEKVMELASWRARYSRNTRIREDKITVQYIYGWKTEGWLKWLGWVEDNNMKQKLKGDCVVQEERL